MNCSIDEQIIQMRKEKIGMKTIAQTLGVTRDKVRYHCRKNGLDGVIAENNYFDKALEIFKNNLTKNNHAFEYVSDFINTESKVRVKCLKCNEVVEKAAQFAKKKSQSQCPNCLENIRKAKEVIDQQRKLAKYLKKKPKKTLGFRVTFLNKTSLIEIKVGTCAECGVVFVNKGRTRVTCSSECSKRHANSKKEVKRRKMELNGEIDSDITLVKLFNRDNGECYLCGDTCDWDDKEERENGTVVGRTYPSIEHVVPISKGGRHTWDNVKLAHHYCNSIKSDKQITEDTGQLVLML